MTALRWANAALFLSAADSLTDTELDGPSRLPGWTRRHVLAHVASNATALGRLVSWARTGRRTPMYASPEQRAVEIERGAQQCPARLRDEVRGTADALADAFASLPDTAWSREVVTAQGRTVPATELPWLRAREVNVHAVDLDAGVGFADLPEEFCAALVADITALRTARGEPPPTVTLPVHRLAAWLAGRDADPVLPALPPWL